MSAAGDHVWGFPGCGGAEACIRCWLIFRFADETGRLPTLYAYGPNSPGREEPYDCIPIESLLAPRKPSDGNIAP